MTEVHPCAHLNPNFMAVTKITPCTLLHLGQCLSATEIRAWVESM